MNILLKIKKAFFKELVEALSKDYKDYKDLDIIINEYLSGFSDKRIFKHKIKLLFVELDWKLKKAIEIQEYVNKFKEGQSIKNLFDNLQDKFFILQRELPNDIETYKLQGKIELLRKILDEGWN